MILFTAFAAVITLLIFAIMYQFARDLTDGINRIDNEIAYYKKLDVCIVKWNKGEK